MDTPLRRQRARVRNDGGNAKSSERKCAAVCRASCRTTARGANVFRLRSADGPAPLGAACHPSGYARCWYRAGRAAARYSTPEGAAPLPVLAENAGNRSGEIAMRRWAAELSRKRKKEKFWREGAKPVLAHNHPPSRTASWAAGEAAGPFAAPRFLEELLLLNQLSEPQPHRATGRSRESCRHRPPAPNHRHRRRQ